MITATHLIGRDLDQSADPRTRAAVHGLEAATERAAILARRILRYPRMADDHEKLTHIDQVLAGIQDLITWAAGPAIKVELACRRDAPPILCNPRELENAVLNLVINARTAMPGGGRVVVACYGEDAAPRGAGTAVLRIADTGCGMSEESSRHMFEPFFTTRPPGVGGGLGLAIVADFVRRAGGTVRVESAVGSGTAITLRFPAHGSDPKP